MKHELIGKINKVLDKGEVILIDYLGDDKRIEDSARISYGGPTRAKNDTRNLIRYLMRMGHTSPFEQVEVVFLLQAPMDTWRQIVRHRTANINEYSTRYTEALDFFQVTDPAEWRLQSTDNKQGSSGFLPKCTGTEELDGEYFSVEEEQFHQHAKRVYQNRLRSGVAKEQARKDLPLSTYTRAYWKCDLHNIFNFLRLRMDSHAQLEIRSFANCMFEIVKQLFPVACEAFEDYVLHAKKFSRMEMELLRDFIQTQPCNRNPKEIIAYSVDTYNYKPSTMTDREWKEFLAKLGT